MHTEGKLGGKETSLLVRVSEHGTSCQVNWLHRLQPSARQEAPDRTPAPAGHCRRIGASLGVMLSYFQTPGARQKASSALPQTLLLTAGLGGGVGKPASLELLSGFMTQMGKEGTGRRKTATHLEPEPTCSVRPSSIQVSPEAGDTRAERTPCLLGGGGWGGLF